MNASLLAVPVTVLDVIPDMVTRFDRGLRHIYVNAAATRVTGIAVAEYIGKTNRDLGMADDLAAIGDAHINATFETGTETTYAFVFPGVDGVTHHYHAHVVPERDAMGNVVSVLTISRDITAVIQVEERLRESEERYHAVLAALDEGVVVQGPDGQIITANASAERILRLQEGQMRGRTSLDPQWAAVHEDGTPFPGESHPAMVALRTGQPQMNVVMGMPVIDGETVWLSVNARPLVHPGEDTVHGVVVSFRDITAYKRTEEQLRYSSLHDSLTGLANRVLLIDRLTQTLARLRRQQDTSFAVLSLDFDGFKQVNDRYGHQAGDDLLIEAARRLRGSIRASDTVARLGGDEFVVVLESASESLEIAPVLRRIRAALRAPFLIGAQEHSLSVSIGIVHGTASYETSKEVLRDVDVALYTAKANGRNCEVIFESGLREQATTRVAVTAPIEGRR